MPSDRPTTTIRYTDEDRDILEKLQKLTGLESASAVVRLAIREALASRQTKRGRR
jgi:Arc/MetJ-type ribon-helix-helix transcriptional regulator